MDQSFFRIVIGCYSHREGHWSARDDLRANGILDQQVCSLGSPLALNISAFQSAGNTPARVFEADMINYQPRRIRELELHVSTASLFDVLWPEQLRSEGSLAHWMTPAQSGLVCSKLREHCALLIVSANSGRQQVKCSQIQLRHRPSVVQAFNFAA